MCLVNRRGLGKGKHVDMQNLWIQEASKSKRFVTKKVGTNVNPADFMTKPMQRPNIELYMNVVGCEFYGTAPEPNGATWYETGGRFDGRKEEGCKFGRSHSEMTSHLRNWF